MTTFGVKRWTPRPTGHRSNRELVRPRVVIEDPIPTPHVEVDWSYVAECARRNPGVWLRVYVDIDGWSPPSGTTSAPLRRDGFRTLRRGYGFYVRFDDPDAD